jgi:hypothetical protein
MCLKVRRWSQKAGSYCDHECLLLLFLHRTDRSDLTRQSQDKTGKAEAVERQGVVQKAGCGQGLDQPEGLFRQRQECVQRRSAVQLEGLIRDIANPTVVAVATIFTAIAAMEVQHKGNRQREANRQRATAGKAFWTRAHSDTTRTQMASSSSNPRLS